MNPQKKMRQMLESQAALTQKWSYLTEGIVFEGWESEEDKIRIKGLVSRLLENQNDELLLAEATDSGDIAQFRKYAFPLITRVFPVIAVQHVCGVQPLTGPVGQIFTYQAKFGSNKGSITAGTNIWNNPSKNYTKELVSTETFQAAGGSTKDYSGTLSWIPIRPGTVTVIIGSVIGVDDGLNNITGTGIAAGTINYTNGKISITLSSGSTSAGTVIYTYNSEGNTLIPEVNFDITSRAIQVSNRPLRFKWTPQAMQDMYRQHGVMADKSFTKSATDLIQREISRDVIDTLLAGATGGSETFSKTRPDYISYEQHKQMLIDHIARVSNSIYKATYRGAGNRLICGKDMLDLVTTLPRFRADNPGAMSKPVGRIGVLNDQWTVVSDIDLASASSIVGYVGDDFLHVGAVYSPYTFQYTDTLLLADDMQYRKGILSRDNFELIDGNFYGTVTITA